ncbi:MAG: 16S rRNA (guanine(527)-N(7))-methyltransferase RsmG [Nitrospirae bacterium]|nr:16S rRNA (guanine(527)-N(7))-methyltransferase RsmG [Nitrospirota bacterium]
MNSDLEHILIDGASRLGVSLSEAQAAAFGVYLDELLKWNRRINLTAITSPREVVIKHFLDSLSICRLIPEGPARAVDIGTGAGFPGLPLKIARPGLDVTLDEPNRKKAAFLRHMARTLGLEGVSVVEDKVEDIQPGEGGFGVVLSRAFRDPALLLPLVRPLLAESGLVALSLGPENTLEPPEGWRMLSEEEITLPYSDIGRRLVVYVPA